MALETNPLGELRDKCAIFRQKREVVLTSLDF